MEDDASIVVLVRAGIHESSEIVGTLSVVSWFLFERVFVVFRDRRNVGESIMVLRTTMWWTWESWEYQGDKRSDGADTKEYVDGRMEERTPGYGESLVRSHGPWPHKMSR